MALQDLLQLRLQDAYIYFLMKRKKIRGKIDGKEDKSEKAER